MQKIFTTLLVTYDFTEKAKNAVRMAVQIAARHDSKVIIFHNMFSHFVIDRTGKQVIGTETIKENSLKTEQSLEELRTSLQEKYPSLNFEIIIKNDGLIQSINEVIEQESIDLVISGTSGQQKFTQLILGSLSYEILNGVNCSVLLVPENCSKYCFDRILVPVRVLEDLTDKIDLSISIAKKNKGVISLLGISNEEDLIKIKDAYQSIRKDLAAESQEYHAQFLLTSDKATQISKFSDTEDADIIILNYKDEDSWKSFFAENFFKQIINNTDLPLLFVKNKTLEIALQSERNVGFDITLPSPG